MILILGSDVVFLQVASQASGSNNYFFHSFEYGPVHAISLTVYVNYLPGMHLQIVSMEAFT